MRSIYKQALATLAVSAAATFAIFYAGNAWANTIYTVTGHACTPYLSTGRVCPIAGGAPLANGLSVVYFDFKSIGAGKLITSVVWRKTPQGSLFIANEVDRLDAGVHETSVSCGSLNPNRSPWDYWFAGVSGDGAGLEVGSNVFGIGVWAL